MRTPSVRTKLTVWNVGVLAFTLSVLGLLIFSGARTSLLASVDKDISSRAQRLASRVRSFISTPPAQERRILIHGVTSGNPTLILPGVREPISTMQIGRDQYEAVLNPPQQQGNDPARSPFRPRILDLNAKTTAHEPPYDMIAFQKAKQGENGFTNVLIDNEPARMLTLGVEHKGQLARIIQYPQPLAGTYSALNGLTVTLVIMIPLIVMVASLGGGFLTKRALEPVREITDTASQIGAESLDGRLEVKGSDEFSRLAGTFNGMLDRLQGAFTRMEQAVEQQRRFTADASHELRTPLTVIKANTSLALRGTRSPDEYKNTLVAVNAAADSMGRLVNDLLMLARSDTGRLEIQREAVCLKPLLKDAIASVSRPGIAEISLVGDEDGQEIIGDGHAILRVFVNLLENAAHYTPQEGMITVEQSRDGDEVVVSVRDTGIGIAPEHLPHLCDRFYRVDEARARAEGGNGLGLSICSSIVEAHHGTMSITSTPGQGTTVTVRLPASAGAGGE